MTAIEEETPPYHSRQVLWREGAFLVFTFLYLVHKIMYEICKREGFIVWIMISIEVVIQMEDAR